jgi:hypothetical protein
MPVPITTATAAGFAKENMKGIVLPEIGYYL